MPFESVFARQTRNWYSPRLSGANFSTRGFVERRLKRLAGLFALLIVACFISFPLLADQFELAGKFATSPTGAATYSIPIAVPPGTNGIAPSLSLQYSSQQTNGVLGLGWVLEGVPSISRCPQTLAQDGTYGRVNYDSFDRFCLDGQRLILVSGAYGADGAQYRTERDNYSKVTSHGTAGTGPAWFEVHSKAGLEMDFGYTAESANALVPVVGSSTARMWGLSEVKDTAGNYYTVSYTADATNGVNHVSEIDYTANSALAPYNSVKFVYAARSDIVPFYRAGALVQETKLLTDIDTYNGGTLVNDTKLAYTTSTSTGRSELASVTLYDANGNSLPSTNFSWQGQSVPFANQPGGVPTYHSSGTLGPFTDGHSAYSSGNFGGNGRSDLLTLNGSDNSGALYLAQENGSYTSIGFNLANLPNKNANYTIVVGDWNGDGKSDIALVPINGGTTYFYLSSGSGFMQMNLTANFGNSIVYVGDFNGDGLSDLLVIPRITNTSASIFLMSGSQSAPSLSQLPGFSPLWNGYNGLPNIILGDWDGDGRTDIAYYDPNSSTGAITFYLAPTFQQESSITYRSSAGTLAVFTPVAGDWNGDGKTDIALIPNYIGSDTAKFYTSTGTGFVPFTFSPSWSTATGSANWVHLVVGDFNGDGMTDIVANTSVWTSTGSSFTNSANGPTGTFLVGALPADADVNGDGAADFWVNATDSSSFTLYATTFSPDLISGFTSGLGATTSVVYSPMDRSAVYTKGTSATYPTQDVQSATYMVSEVLASNGIGGTYNTNYSYKTGQADTQGRGFLGFGTTTALDDQTGIYSSINYGLAWPYTGFVSSATRTTGGTMVGAPGVIALSNTTNGYTITSLSAGVTQTLLTSSSTSRAELDGSALDTTASTMGYDYCGNLMSMTVLVNGGYAAANDGHTTTTTDTYSLPTLTNGDCFTDKLSTVAVADTTPGVSAGAGPETVTRTTNYGYDPTTGLQNQTVAEPSGGTLRLETDYGRDGYGNISSTTVYTYNAAGVATGRVTSFTYDSNERFLATVTNALGQVEKRTYDPRFGGMASSLWNSQTTSWTYDGFGRKATETRSDGTQTIWSYFQAVNCPPLGCAIEEQSTGAPKVYTFYDTLERVLSVGTPSFDGATTIVTDLTAYDALGRVKSVAQPYLANPGTEYQTTYTYDALGRVYAETRPDGGTVTTTRTASNLQDVTTATLSYSGSGFAAETTQTVKNSRGDTTALTDALGHVSTYAYHPFNNLGQVTSPAGNLSKLNYDVRGNKISDTTPDRGGWTYSYDGLGEMLTQTDANSQQTTMVYDLLGRIKTRSDPSAVRTFTYDTQPYGVGKLATATTGSNYLRTESYDFYGRPSQTSLLEDGVTTTAGTSYDGSGRVASKTYPSGFTVGYLYNANGYLTSVTNGTGGTALWTAVQRDAYLNLTQETYGNGIVTNQQFYATTGRVNTIQVSGGSIANLTYSWDVAGNLTSRIDGLNRFTETFGYDGLNRVTGSAIGGVNKTITYDLAGEGNIVTKSDVGGTYLYPAAGTAQPHAVQSISGGTINSGAGLSGSISNPTYSYDYNGNMQIGGGRSVVYTASNRAASITYSGGTIAYEYDASDQRYSQAAPEGTTYYWNAQGVTSEKFTAAGSGPVTWRNYITAGDETIGVTMGGTAGTPTAWGAANWGAFTWSGGTTTAQYFHGDHLGSVIALTNAAGTLIESDAYDAWGKRRNPNGVDDTNDTISPSQANRGFTTQEQVNDVAWLNLNARMYDPQIGKFMSADPIVAHPISSQGWNRYAYVQNNPLNSTDPTGMIETILVTSGCNADSCYSSSSQVEIGQSYGATAISLSLTSPGTTTASTGISNKASGESQDSNNKVVLEELVVTTKRHPPVKLAANDDAIEPLVDLAILGGMACYIAPSCRELFSQHPSNHPTDQPHLMKQDNASDENGNSPTDTNNQGQGQGDQATQDKGCIYCVPGDATQSGKDYVGRTDDLGQRQKDSSDGRDRSKADVVDTYPKGDKDAGRAAEQKAMNDRGGVDNLDNKRNEIAPNRWPNFGVAPPPQQ